MLRSAEAVRRLHSIPNLTVFEGAPLAGYTRFGIGGPADVLVETADVNAFADALDVVRALGEPFLVIGGGTNLIVSDEGYRGVVLRLAADRVEADGTRVRVEAGALLHSLVEFTVEHGLKGLETLAGIPGWVGAAIYGNAGAYGHSISERVAAVTYLDADGLHTIDTVACEFRYRESIFKRRKERVIVSAELAMDAGERAELVKTSADIVAVRNEKFPPTMKCAGSIFKNLLAVELPAAVAAAVPAGKVREGKIPAAYFLEQVGAKGLRQGGIVVADYHANLIYNTGGGTARELTTLLAELKARVRERFGIAIEEEVQFVGFSCTAC